MGGLVIFLGSGRGLVMAVPKGENVDGVRGSSGIRRPWLPRVVGRVGGIVSVMVVDGKGGGSVSTNSHSTVIGEDGWIGGIVDELNVD